MRTTGEHMSTEIEQMCTDSTIIGELSNINQKGLEMSLKYLHHST